MRAKDSPVPSLCADPQFDLPNSGISAFSAAGTISGTVGMLREIQFGLRVVLNRRSAVLF